LEAMDAATEWTAKSRLLRGDHAPAAILADSENVH